jgi:GAF domain-containing protein
MEGGPGPAAPRPWWWPVALPAGLTGAAWLIQVLVSADLPSWGRIVLVLAGTLSALLAFALPARQLAVERRNRDAAEQLASEAVATYKIKVHDMLIPLALTVGEAVAAHRAPERRDAQAALRQMAVAFAAENVGPERSRACYYQLAGSAPRRHVDLKNWHGRHKVPRPRFTEDSPRGALVMDIIKNRDARLVEDVDTACLPGWSAGGSEYRTFICAAVSAGPRVFGILTVDSLHPGDLTDDDLDMARLFAHLLATGLAAD